MSAFNPDLEIDDIVFRIYSHYDFECFDGWEVDEIPYKIIGINTYSGKYGTTKTVVLRSEKYIFSSNQVKECETQSFNVFKSLQTAQKECQRRNELEKQTGFFYRVKIGTI